MRIFNLPDLGEGLGEAEIVSWHVAVGDHVVADQPLVSVETDKAIVEIPSPYAGRIGALHGAPGDIVKTGTPFVEFETPGGTDDPGAVVGHLPRPSSAQSGPAPPIRQSAAGTSPRRASPAVRALASHLGVDLARAHASGPDGSITRADVEAVRRLGGRNAHPSERAIASAEPLRGVRRSMARNMANAHAQVVPATITEIADVHDWSQDNLITLRLLRAVVAGCRSEPALNAWFFGPDEGRRLHTCVDLALAMDTADGLFAPVLRDVGSRDADDLHRALARLKQDVRERTLPKEQLHGATITLSNFGTLGGLHATLVVMPPQVAIIGAGRVHHRVVAHREQAVVRRMLPLSLTFDHRAVTGGEATRFLTALVADLSLPE